MAKYVFNYDSGEYEYIEIGKKCQYENCFFCKKKMIFFLFLGAFHNYSASALKILKNRICSL